MGRFLKSLALAAGLAAAMAGAALAQPAQDRGRESDRDTPPQIPQCVRSLGSITLADGDRKGWATYNLSSPQTVLRAIVQRSRCFSLVDAERDQDRATDYVLVAEVVSSDPRGGGLGGILGNLFSGRFRALASGVRGRRQEAQAVLSLTDVDTSETSSAQIRAQNRDSGEGYSFAGAVAGGWEDTDTGRALSAAFIEAYAQLVTQLGGLDANAAGANPLSKP
jgi:hypothetical protein